jgi:hypothetical protein
MNYLEAGGLLGAYSNNFRQTVKVFRSPVDARSLILFRTYAARPGAHCSASPGDPTYGAFNIVIML